jgi:uncharacterized membrane protein
VGSAYSVVTTITPMAVVIGNILLMRWALDYSETTTYNNRELFQVTILYIFMFSLIGQSPFNAVLSKYVADEIFKEQFENIRAAFNVGLFLNIILDCAMAIPFTLHEYYVGHVDIVYILVSIVCFIALSLTFYTIMFLSLCKDYGKVSLFYIIGMAAAFLLSYYFAKNLGMEVTLSMLLGLAIGFLLIAAVAYALLRQYFKKNSRHYFSVIKYICRFWKLVGANLFYTLGLFVHNFVFWTSSLRNVVANSFVCAESYDFATCIGMFTNLSSTVIFVVLVETNFNSRYKQYSEAIIGGRLIDIKKSKSRMMRMMSELLMSLVRIQFVVSIVLFLLCMIILQRLGFSGIVLQLYPCLAAAYFIVYIMYAAFMFLYYFNDLDGSLVTSLIFCVCTLLGSLVSMRLDVIWYGLGLLFGGFCGWTYAFFRLKHMENTLHIHVFCNGNILAQEKGKRPSGMIYGEEPAEKKTKKQRGKVV